MAASTAPKGHWFADQLQVLLGLAAAHATRRAKVVAGDSATEAEERQAREVLVTRLRSLCQEVGERAGVDGCVVSHDGLALDAAGGIPDHEAVAAMAQVCLAAAHQTVLSLRLGELGQFVIIGERQKFAQFAVGDFCITILADREVPLSEVLA